MRRRAYIDGPQRARRFEPGDLVQILNERTGEYFKWVGVVTAVDFANGMVDVETPLGNERYRAEIVGPSEGPPLLTDTSYDTLAKESAMHRRLAARYVEGNLGGLRRAASRGLGRGMGDLECYDNLFRRASGRHSDAEIRDAVRLAALERVGLYWKEKGRQYMPSKQELEDSAFTCPKCKDVELVKANYKKNTKLLACPECLFLIRPEDIIDREAPDDEGELDDVKLPQNQQQLADEVWDKAKSAGLEERLEKLASKNPEVASEIGGLLSALG